MACIERIHGFTGERIHGLNLLCGASLKDDELRIAMREVDNENPNEMYNRAKKLLKKYYGSSSISNQTTAAATSSVQTALIKKHCKPKYRYRDTRSSSEKSTLIKKNPIGRNSQQLQCHIYCSIAHSARNCPHKTSCNYDNMRHSPNDTYVATLLLNVKYRTSKFCIHLIV